MLSIKHGKEIEEAFGLTKIVGRTAQTVYRGIERGRARFIITTAANNPTRLPRPLST